MAANQLDRQARQELRSLSKDNADQVARHLVMAGRLLDDDPALAHRHAQAAAATAGRIAVVRETVALTAYTVGDFSAALREFRTYRRLSGRNDQLPLMVECERGLGRPERALELGRSVDRGELPVAVRVSLAIAMSGARLDLGQAEAAMLELQIAELDPERAFPWSPALFEAVATVLEEQGKQEQADEWFDRADRASEALAASEGEAFDDDEVEIELLDDPDELLDADAPRARDPLDADKPDGPGEPPETGSSLGSAGPEDVSGSGSHVDD